MTLFSTSRSPRFLAALLSIFCLTGCEKRIGDAVVLSKEYIAAAEPTATPSPNEQSDTVTFREMKDDEISVDGYVIKAADRGTGRDPRASKEEKWRLKVQASNDGRSFNVPVDSAQFGKLHEGDRVRVRYHVGKYTGTVWGAEVIP